MGVGASARGLLANVFLRRAPVPASATAPHTLVRQLRVLASRWAGWPGRGSQGAVAGRASLTRMAGSEPLVFRWAPAPRRPTRFARARTNSPGSKLRGRRGVLDKAMEGAWRGKNTTARRPRPERAE